ncbi:MAG: tetratricopeptide repeat protein, partial [Nitrososphaeria archaeon]|nr:tetratricopeptide repeat protein [Nitrososphaeria archaeon]
MFIPGAFSLTPMVDLSGKWSGSGTMRDVDGYCSFTGSVTAILQQSGDSLTGQYEFTITNSRSTGKLESMTCSSDSSARGFLEGKVDGTIVTMVDRGEGIMISGTATNDLLILDFADSYVTGTVKLQKFADFSKPNLSKSQPSTTPQMIEIGMSYLNEKRFDKALESFNKIVGKEPNNIMGQMGKGVSYVGLHKYQEAITQFKKSLEISPNNKDALAWLGRTYYLQNDCQTASKYYSAALTVDPQNSKMLTEQKIVNSCLAKQVEEKNKAKSLESKLNPKSETENPPTLVDPNGNPIKPDLKSEPKKPTLVDPNGNPIKPD